MIYVFIIILILHKIIQIYLMRETLNLTLRTTTMILTSGDSNGNGGCGGSGCLYIMIINGQMKNVILLDLL